MTPFRRAKQRYRKAQQRERQRHPMDGRIRFQIDGFSGFDNGVLVGLNLGAALTGSGLFHAASLFLAGASEVT